MPEPLLIRPMPATDMTPDDNGLFTIEQVAVLAGKRNCNVYAVSGLRCELRHGDNKPAAADAIQENRWTAVEIYKSCRVVNGQRWFGLPEGKQKFKDPDGLNEKLIVETIGADGVNPYLSRKGLYTIVEKTDRGEVERRPQAGEWTWPLFCLFEKPAGAAKSSEYRRALYALSEAGLIALTLGRHRGIWSSSFEWTARAHYPLSEEELAFISEIGQS